MAEKSSQVGEEMAILAFDTATYMCSVAFKKKEAWFEKNHLAPQAHMEKLLPSVSSCLKKAKLNKKDIEKIVVGLGPGSFTGVRIGVATARGLAQALGVPLVGVSTLDCLALGCPDGDRIIGAVIDARRGEVYFSFYQPPPDFKRLVDFSVARPEDFCRQAKTYKEIVLVGDGLATYGGLFKQKLDKLVSFAPKKFWYPKAINLIKLAEMGLGTEKDYFEIAPIYIRQPIAEEQWKKKRKAKT